MVQYAAILAGGLGTRLRSVVNDRPKVMAVVAGRPFVTRLLDQLSESGIRKAVLCTGYRADAVRTELGDRYRRLELVYSVEEAPLGTGGALRLACEILPAEKLLVLNGDSYCNCDLAEFITAHEASGASAGMVLANVADVSRFGTVKIDNSSFVESFIEKGAQSGPGWINAGIYLFPEFRLRALPLNHPVSLEQEIIPHLVADGIYGYQCPGTFIDIGIPEDFQRAQLLFSEKEEGKP